MQSRTAVCVQNLHYFCIMMWERQRDTAPRSHPQSQAHQWELSKQLDWAAALLNSTASLSQCTNILLFYTRQHLTFLIGTVWLYATAMTPPAQLLFLSPPCSISLQIIFSLANVPESLCLLLNTNTLTQWNDFIIFKTSSTSDYFALIAQRTFTCNLDM